MDDALRQLRAIIRQKSLRIGEFTLSSGKRSSYYLDCRMTTLDPTGALLIGRLMLDCIRKRNIQADAIGGLTIGADPIATAVAVVSALEGQPLPAFIVRKETKGHGTQRSIEGYDGKPGSRVLVVDDVCTTGDSILKAAEKAEEDRLHSHCRFLRGRSRRRGHRTHCQAVSFLSTLHGKGTIKGCLSSARQPSCLP